MPVRRNITTTVNQHLKLERVELTKGKKMLKLIFEITKKLIIILLVVSKIIYLKTSNGNHLH